MLCFKLIAMVEFADKAIFVGCVCFKFVKSACEYGRLCAAQTNNSSSVKYNVLVLNKFFNYKVLLSIG